MADETAPETANAEAETEQATGLRGRIARLLNWAKASKLRMGLVGLLFVILFGGLFATWSYLAHLAVSQEEKKTIAMAFEALDTNNFEDAKNIVGEIQTQNEAVPEFGGALFVLGAVKAAQADMEWSQDRQRAMHLVAARYLQKARELGVPQERKDQAELLVGRSLIRGNRPQAGIEILQNIIDRLDRPAPEIHLLLAAAYQSTAEPNLAAALQHMEAVLSSTNLDPKLRNDALVTQADLLAQLGRLEEARQQLQVTGSGPKQQAKIKSLTGKIAIAEAEKLSAEDPQKAALATQALADLREAQRLDPLNSALTRQAMYWIGKL